VKIQKNDWVKKNGQKVKKGAKKVTKITQMWEDYHK
jgi:hypothetical protein